MNLAPVLARLKSQLTGFVVIGGAADLQSIDNDAPPAPSCFLVMTSEVAEDNTLLGGYEQRLTIGFSVVLVVSNVADATGSAAMGDLEALRSQVKTALIGWPPEPAIGEPVRYAAGHQLRFDDGLLWWADEFRVITYLRSV
ncbi:phage tail terminator protein [Propionivibrio sp.]|uniref:phage tail terminator protein n=1 Tax=Propionivibrio sp. TaxID=2212460 RepID=UPI003BF0BA2D